MQQKTINKMYLCLQEMHYIKEILDNRCADNQLAHLLSIYAAMRMSDFVLMLPIYQKRNSKKAYIEAYSQVFEEKLEVVRNKLGAHFQRMVNDEQENKNDLSERNKLYQSIDYKTVKDLIESAEIVFQIVTDKENEELYFDNLCTIDKQTIVTACQRLYRDNGARIYNDILNISRPNAISVFMCTDAQRKVQQVITMRMFVEDIRYLYSKVYQNIAVKRLFKRMLVGNVMNFYDNLVTRKKDKSLPQYERGLDEMVLELFDNKKTADVRERIIRLFESMKTLKHSDEILAEAWDVRNFCCSHFDNTSDVSDLNGRIDSFNVVPLLSLYDKWLSTFKEILNQHVMLAPLNLPTDQVIYDAQIERLQVSNFYGAETAIGYNSYMTSNLSIMDAVDIVSKRIHEKMNLASQKIHNVLFNAKGKEYQELKRILIEKYRGEMEEQEMYFFLDHLYKAKQGFPNIIQGLLLTLWEEHKKKPEGLHKYVLTPMYANAHFDKDELLIRVINELKSSNSLIHRTYGLLILFHATKEQDVNPYNFLQDPPFNHDVLEYIEGGTDEKEKFYLSLSMAAFWFTDTAFHRPRWSNYDHVIMEILIEKYNRYGEVLEIEKSEGWEELTGLLENHKFMEFTWSMMKVLEKTEEIKQYHGAIRNYLLGRALGVKEEAYYALCWEECGELQIARDMLYRIMSEHSIDPGLAISFCNFLGRHEAYKEEQKKLKEEILDEYTLTEEQKNWIQS